MANVYEIWIEDLEVYKAVKLLHPTASKNSRERFKTEVKISAKMNHPNVIDIHSIGEWNGLPYIEMEIIRGKTCQELLNHYGAFPPYVATSIGIMVCRALNYAHKLKYRIYNQKYTGLIHRDIKPSNVIINNTNGVVKLMDFGIAKPTTASFHTTEGTIVGTLQYLSPEQLQGKQPDVTADIYSLGALLYELLTGTQAFPEENVSKLMVIKLKNKYKKLNEFKLKIPSRLKRVIEKSMHSDKTKRIKSAKEFQRELERIHRKFTTASPEMVCYKTLKTPRKQKIIVPTRFVFPVKGFSIGALSAAALITGGTYLYKRSTSWYNEVTTPRIIKEEVTREKQAEEDKDEGSDEGNEGNKGKFTGATYSARTTPEHSSVRPDASLSKAYKEKQDSLIQRLKEKHKTGDIHLIIKNEYNSGNYSNIQKLNSRRPELAENNKAIAIYVIKSLIKLDMTSKADNLISDLDTEDGELYLVKGIISMKNGDIGSAENNLERAINTPSMLINDDEKRIKAYYYQALCSSKRFYKEKDQESYDEAIQRWYKVKSKLRDRPSHSYYKRADDAIQKIGNRFRRE
ncbi:MAG: serine/threonine-protein kinase, partial [Chitinivibrionales bacterium]